MLAKTKHHRFTHETKGIVFSVSKTMQRVPIYKVETVLLPDQVRIHPEKLSKTNRSRSGQDLTCLLKSEGKKHVIARSFSVAISHDLTQT